MMFYRRPQTVIFWVFKQAGPNTVLYRKGWNSEPRSTANINSDIDAWLNKGAPRGFGDLGRMAIYFQGAEEHWYLFQGN